MQPIWLFYLPYAIILMPALASYLLKKLTLWASLAAIIVAIFIYRGAGYNGLGMLGAFFVLSVAVTGWHKHDKEVLKASADRGSHRDLWQVLANGGVAAGCGLLACCYHQQVFGVMMAGSLAAAMADTLSSELGMVYGRRFYNVMNFKPDKKGLDGVVSLEGSVIGIAGAALIALISKSFWIVVISGFLGNYIDSVLGATLERKNLLNNNMVNFLNTLTGALVGLALIKLSL